MSSTSVTSEPRHRPSASATAARALARVLRPSPATTLRRTRGRCVEQAAGRRRPTRWRSACGCSPIDWRQRPGGVRQELRAPLPGPLRGARAPVRVVVPGDRPEDDGAGRAGGRRRLRRRRAGPADGPRELPDHVSVELEFCYLLGTAASRKATRRRLARLDSFWRDQLLPWLPSFAAAVEEHADHPVFRRAQTRRFGPSSSTAPPRPRASRWREHVMEPEIVFNIQSGIAWDWRVAMDLYLGGAGVGAILFAVLIDHLFAGRYRRLSQTAAWLGPVLVAIGLVLIMAKMGRPFNAWQNYVNVSPLSPLVVGRDLPAASSSASASCTPGPGSIPTRTCAGAGCSASRSFPSRSSSAPTTACCCRC